MIIGSFWIRVNLDSMLLSFGRKGKIKLLVLRTQGRFDCMTDRTFYTVYLRYDDDTVSISNEFLLLTIWFLRGLRALLYNVVRAPYKKSAATENRTRAKAMATLHSTTKLLQLG